MTFSTVELHFLLGLEIENYPEAQVFSSCIDSAGIWMKSLATADVAKLLAGEVRIVEVRELASDQWNWRKQQ